MDGWESLPRLRVGGAGVPKSVAISEDPTTSFPGVGIFTTSCGHFYGTLTTSESARSLDNLRGTHIIILQTMPMLFVQHS